MDLLKYFGGACPRIPLEERTHANHPYTLPCFSVQIKHQICKKYEVCSATMWAPPSESSHRELSFEWSHLQVSLDSSEFRRFLVWPSCRWDIFSCVIMFTCWFRIPFLVGARDTVVPTHPGRALSWGWYSVHSGHPPETNLPRSVLLCLLPTRC